MRSQCSLLLFLGAVAAAAHWPAQPRNTNATQVGYISVAVATLWTNSSKPRPVDSPALTNPAQIEQWLHDMTTAQSLDLTTADRTQTQALFGTRVNILTSPQDGWYEVAANGQPTPKNPLGYPGWVPAAQVSLDDTFGQLQASRPFALVARAATVPIYRDAALSAKFMDISYNTQLPVLTQSAHAVQVAVPGGSAYLAAADVQVYRAASDIPYPRGADLVAAAKLFVGRPYLWGGMSGFAFDCSGFTHTLYAAHGIIIPRDSTAEATFTGHGQNVSRDDLQAGDLIFYASQVNNPQTIYHVAMYAGNGTMAEAYAAGTPVRFTPVRFNKDYWGAQRFLKH